MKYYPLKMEDQTTSESFPEKENKIEVTLSDNNNDYNNNNQSIPKFEDIVDIKVYPKKISNLNQIKSKKKKFEKEPNLKFCCKKIGHTLCLFSDKYGNPLIMIGPHWPMYVFFCGGVTAGYILFFINFFSKLNIIIKLFGIFSFLMYFISYTGTFCLNPGYPKRDENSLVGKPRVIYKRCLYCDIWERVDMDITHCYDCGVCVEGYDHHCPWTGKCIGKNTIKYFYTFITSVLVVFVFFVCALVNIDLNTPKKRK